MTQDRHVDNPQSAVTEPQGLTSSQFSVQTLLIATTAVAVLCCIFFVLPSWVVGIVLLIAILIAMPATLAALIYGTGQTRAFAVGASPPLCIILFSLMGLAGRGGPSFNFNVGNDDVFAKMFFAIVIFVVVTSGFVAQLVRSWCLWNESN